jgi:hypothetical protein
LAGCDEWFVRAARPEGVTTMKFQAKSAALAIAFSAIAMCSNAYAAGTHAVRHGRAPGGMQNKAAMMAMVTQLTSGFGGQGGSPMSGGFNPADLMSQLGR